MTIRLPDDLEKFLKSRKARVGLSMNWIVIEALRTLRDLKKQQPRKNPTR